MEVVYIDFAYRLLVNRSLYISSGLGLKVGKLSTEKCNGFKDSLNYGYVAFFGFKHNSGIEVNLQEDIRINNSKGNQGFILNIKHKIFSIEVGLSNLYRRYNTDSKSLFGTLRLNITEIIGSFFDIKREVSKILKIEFLIGYDKNIGPIYLPEISIGLSREEADILDSYKEVDSIYKNNTMEYGNNITKEAEIANQTIKRE